MRAARLWARGQLKTPHRFPPEEDPETPGHADADDTDETAEVLAAFGLRLEGDTGGPAADEDTPLHLWPENWPIWCLWVDVQTQWRESAMGGASGLDYAGVDCIVADRVRKRERKVAKWLLQAMEHVTLQEWAKRRQAASR